MSERPKVQHSKCCVVQATPGSNPGATAINSRHAMRGGIFISDGALARDGALWIWGGALCGGGARWVALERDWRGGGVDKKQGAG